MGVLPRQAAVKAVKQIVTPYLPEPIMQRQYADREEKRVT